MPPPSSLKPSAWRWCAIPNVITVHGADMRGGVAGFWMELVHGVTLDRVIRDQGPLGAREAALVGTELCQALAAVHHAGLVHGDVKPRNVMREEGGRYLLMDFGAARDSALWSEDARLGVVGTPYFMAPEIHAGLPATARSDLYSLGVLLYFIVTREYPVSGASMDEIRTAHAAGRRRRLRDARPDLSGAFVQTVERALCADPAERFATAGEMEQALASTLPNTGGRKRLDRRMLLAGLAGAAVVVAALVAGNPLRMFSPDPAHSIRRIAVLPLQNLGGADQRYVADGVTDLLIAKLSELSSLQVISQTSSRLYHGSSKTLPEIARELRADAVVEGSVLKSGTRVRVSLRLIHAGADTPLWADSLERDLSELLALQGDLARGIATRIQVSLTGSEQRRLQAPDQVHVEAQDEYLRGAAALHELTPDAVRTSAAHFESAVRIDPSFARAWALLSHAYWYLATTTASFGERDALYERTKEAAARALSLDANLPRAHSALGQAKFYIERDWAGAEAEFRHAIALDPSDADSRERLGWFLAAHARFDEALSEMRLARELDPLAAERRSPLAAVLYYARRYDEAATELMALTSLKPDWLPAQFGFARVQAARGLTSEALRQLDAPAYRPLIYVQVERARVQAASGDTVKATETLQALLARRQAGEYIAPDALALVYIALGDRSMAHSLLDVAYAERESGLVWLKVDPRFDPIRQDPMFVALLHRVGFT